MNDPKEVCPKCSGKTEMYYKFWCPVCDKPKFKTIQGNDTYVDVDFSVIIYDLKHTREPILSP